MIVHVTWHMKLYGYIIIDFSSICASTVAKFLCLSFINEFLFYFRVIIVCKWGVWGALSCMKWQCWKRMMLKSIDEWQTNGWNLTENLLLKSGGKSPWIWYVNNRYTWLVKNFEHANKKNCPNRKLKSKIISQKIVILWFRQNSNQFIFISGPEIK